MTAPQQSTPPPAEHAPEPTPDQSNLAQDVAALLLLHAAASLTAAAIFALLRRRGVKVRKDAVAVALTLATRRTKHEPRMVGRSDVARAQRGMEAFYRAAYIVNAAGRLSAAVDAAEAAAAASRATAGELRDPTEEEARLTAENALRAATRRERTYELAHERARKRRMDAAVAVAEAADWYGPLLGWYSHRDDRTTPECQLADGTNFRADLPPIIGWPGTLHGGTCRCEPGPPFPGARSTDAATGFGPRRAA